MELTDGAAQLPLLPHAAAAGLTRLALPRVVLRDEPGQLRLLLQEVARFTNLQHLTLRLSCLQADAAPALTTAWQAVQSLTYLQLDGIAGYQLQLGQLTKLQVLSVGFAYASSCPAGLQQLQHLTDLTFCGHFHIRPDDSSSIGRLTNLRSLKLAGQGRGLCNTGALSGVTALQSATFSTVRWGSTAALKPWLAAQQQLTLLRCSYNDSGELAAVAAIRGLQHLHFDQHMPSDSLQHMFSQRRQLLHLLTLHLGEYEAYSGLQRSVISLMTTADAVAVAQGCPALRSLQGGTLPAVPAFSNLRHLTCLHVAQVRGEEQTGALALLTGLRQLRLCSDHGSGKKKQNDWRPLGKLSNLSHLSIAPAPGYGSAVISDSKFEALQALTRLVRLECECGLDDQQLQGLSILTRLTHLQFCPWRLGVLVLDRLPPPAVHIQGEAPTCVIANKAGGFDTS